MSKSPAANSKDLTYDEELGRYLTPEENEEEGILLDILGDIFIDKYITELKGRRLKLQTKLQRPN